MNFNSIYFKLSLALFVIINLSNCYSGILIPSEEINHKKMSDISSINGTYSNLSKDSTSNNQDSFWRHLKPFFKDNFYEQANSKNKNLSVAIKVISSDKIQFDLIEGNSTLSSKRYKFDRVGNQIKLKKNKMLEGVPIFFYRHHTEVIILSLSIENNLIVSYEGQASGGLFIFVFGENIQGKSTFQKI